MCLVRLEARDWHRHQNRKGRSGHHAEAEEDKNQQEYVVLIFAIKDSWKNDQGDYESRTDWHCV